ncbi:MAG TPA: polysaccharide biosynthesis tyrosine autokinase [Pyrinomonadaceae bacterium]|nr:polysaccharide biosynthesis tyrosine autokinase [Pyrinomonadaceae bacterium]
MNEHKELITLEPDGPEHSRLSERYAPSYVPSRDYEQDAEEKIHLRDYWVAARKHVWLVVGITLLTTSLATIYMASKPDIYEAEARVLVNQESPNPALGSAKNSSVIVSNADPAYFSTQLQIMTGPGLLRRVAKTLDLEHNQSFIRTDSSQNNSTWRNVLRMFGIKGKSNAEVLEEGHGDLPLRSAVAPATPNDDLADAKRLAPYVAALQENLTVEPVKETRLSVRDTHLIDVSFRHPDPQVAAKVVNAVADTFALANLEKKTESNTTTGDYLQARIAELQSQIRTDGERLSNYAKGHQILSLDASQNTVVDRLAGLNRQLLEAENDRKLAEAAYRAALNPGAASALAEGSVNQINELEQKVSSLRQQRAQMLIENTEKWPEVKDIDSQIAALEKELAETRQRSSSTLVTNLKTKYDEALARENALRDSFNQQRVETVTQNEAAINYRLIQQELDTNKAMLDGLMQRSKENEVVEAGTPNNIYVVDYAVAPDAAVAPKRVRGIALALALSLTFGIGLAFFLEYLDDTIASIEDVERMLHLPTLAAIPLVGGWGRRRRLLLPGSKALKRAGNGNGGPPELLVNADARSGMAEAYRHLRTSILLSTAGQPPQSILVTSSLPAEGKTTTAINTAASLAQTGVEVLILDADMRRPRVHTVFGVRHQEGLSTLLAKEFTEEEVMAMIKHDEASGLYLLPSGTVPPNPAELIGSPQMRRLLEILKRRFCHIIIDSPPIATFTDGVLISRATDGVLMVVHGGKSSSAVVHRSCQQLRNVGAKVIGVVMNKINLRPDDEYYYYNYYQNSYYSSSDEDARAGNGNGNGNGNGKKPDADGRMLGL